MSNKEKKIEQLFLDKQKVIDANLLESIIKSSLLINEETGPISNIKSHEILKFLPKFEFTEDVGDIDSQARKDFEILINQKLAQAQTIEEKINYLKSFSSTVSKKNDTKEILTNLMLLKVLINIFRRSSYGSAGMQFEAFVAGLLGGKQIKRDIQLNVIDVQIGQENYQIKAVGKDNKVKMSYTNLKNYFEGYKDDKGNIFPAHESLNFLVLEKIGGTASDSSSITGLKFSSGVMTKNSFRTLQPAQEFTVPKQFYNKDLGQVVISDKIIKDYSKSLEGNLKTVLLQVANLVNNVNLFYMKGSTNAAKAGVDNASIIKNSLDTANIKNE